MTRTASARVKKRKQSLILEVETDHLKCLNSSVGKHILSTQTQLATVVLKDVTE